MRMLDYEPSTISFLQEVLAGLSNEPKTLPTKYLYDERGSQLFDAICQLEEYYPTRTELAILREHGAAMARALGLRTMLVEFGSGSSVKTRLLLNQLQALAAYVPVDISREHLEQTTRSLAAAYPHIRVLPVCADFTQQFTLPEVAAVDRTAVYMPGSTIGNFEPEFAEQVLGLVSELCGDGGQLLIGIDLQKDVDTIVAAYNDAAGVTAEFNLNLLQHINRELGADFDLSEFRHEASYNGDEHRIEMYLTSTRDQVVNVGDEEFDFTRGESICTEHSHKYTIDGFAEMAAFTGLELQQAWTDPADAFAVLLFEVRN